MLGVDGVRLTPLPSMARLWGLPSAVTLNEIGAPARMVLGAPSMAKPPPIKQTGRRSPSGLFPNLTIQGHARDRGFPSTQRRRLPGRKRCGSQAGGRRLPAAAQRGARTGGQQAGQAGEPAGVDGPARRTTTGGGERTGTGDRFDDEPDAADTLAISVAGGGVGAVVIEQFAVIGHLAAAV